MYGTQAISQLMAVTVPFENDVNMYGTQAADASTDSADGLRMM